MLEQHPAWSRHVELGAIAIESDQPEESDALMLINSAENVSELEALPTIGRVSAERIFVARPDNGYSSLAEVKKAPNLTSGIDWSAVEEWEA